MLLQKIFLNNMKTMKTSSIFSYLMHTLSEDCIQAGLNTLVGWGLQMFMKVLGLVSYMEKMISDPSEPTFVVRVCQICKIPKL